MDLADLKRFKRITEFDNINQEIFQTTSEYKYYLLGVSQALSVIYDLLNQYSKNKDYKNICEELIHIIDDYTKEDEKIAEYYNRLKKDIK